MLQRVVEECRLSEFSPRIIVSTESESILHFCGEHSIETLERPTALAQDHTPKQEVIVNAVQTLFDREGFKPDIVVSLQVNTPEFQATDLDRAMHFFLTKVFPHSPIREVITIGPDHIQNGAFRIMTFETVFQRTLSSYVGIFYTDYLDVHYADDLKEVETRIRNRQTSPENEQ